MLEEKRFYGIKQYFAKGFIALTPLEDGGLQVGMRYPDNSVMWHHFITGEAFSNMTDAEVAQDIQRAYDIDPKVIRLKRAYPD